MLDVFNNNAFKLLPLTAAINEQPHVPGRISSMGLFQWAGIPTTSLAIESVKGVLKLVPTSPRGGPGHQHTPTKRTARNLSTVHIQVDDHVAADEVQGVREFGQENRLQTVQSVVNDRFMTMGRDIDGTIEHLQMGAIKGQILDADGSTVLLDLFTEFGVTALADIDFTLGTSTTNIKALCNQVIRANIDELGETPMGRVHALCGDDFYDGLSTHAEVRDSYHRQQDSAFLRSGASVYESFTYGEIEWENYRGAVAGTPFVAANECRFFVKNVPGLFIGRYSPADYNETVNTMGLPRYAKLVADMNDKGASLELQSNPLPLCTRPRTLRRGFTSN
jgi:hypothetical protein